MSAAGVCTILEFRGNNQLESYSAVITDEKYRLVGTDTILLQSGNRREEKQELEWDNPNRARIEDEAAGKKIELSRIGPNSDSKQPLAGEWRTTREWNGKTYPARALFSSGGSVIWITELRFEQGRYSVQDRNIRLDVPYRPPVEGQFAVENNRLVLPNPGGGQTSFDRF